MKKSVAILFFCKIFMLGCIHSNEKLITKTHEVGDKKCTIQQMPEEFHEGKQGGDFDYFRIIIESNAAINDSSHVNFVNFGIEQSVRKINGTDTILPAFVLKIANGKKNNYEYLVSFQKSKSKESFRIDINDEVFEIGKLEFQF